MNSRSAVVAGPDCDIPFFVENCAYFIGPEAVQVQGNDTCLKTGIRRTVEVQAGNLPKLRNKIFHKFDLGFLRADCFQPF